MSELKTEILEFPISLEIYTNEATGEKYNLGPLLEWMDQDSFDMFLQRWVEDLNGIMLGLILDQEKPEIKYIQELADIQYGLFYLKDCLNAMKVISEGDN